MPREMSVADNQTDIEQHGTNRFILALVFIRLTSVFQGATFYVVVLQSDTHIPCAPAFSIQRKGTFDIVLRDSYFGEYA